MSRAFRYIEKDHDFSMDNRKNITREYVIRSKDPEIVCRLFRKNCKRLRIAVTPELKVIITAPLHASDSFINEAIREKTPWIIRSIQRLKNCSLLPVPENYVSGEKLAFIGKEYMLKVITGKRAPARLAGDLLIVQLPESGMKSVKRAVDKWYRMQAEEVFSRYLEPASKGIITVRLVPTP